jgi:hypothetical protein
VVSHKKESKPKECIKPFNLDVNQITGLVNFSEISKDPLAIPFYGQTLPETTSQPAKS